MSPLEVSHKYKGNHPGLLVMDELPQQQSVEDVDFFCMLDYVLRLEDSEIIVGTSHESQESQLLLLDNQEFISGLLARAI